MIDPINFLHEKTNLSLHITQALDYSMPPPFLLGRSVVRAAEIDNTEVSPSRLEGMSLIVPMKFNHPDDSESSWFELPTDPLVSISCRNLITRRYVAKQQTGGSIKESWNRDDFEINIAGVLVGHTPEQLEAYMKKLRRYCQAEGAIGVQCGILLKVFGIQKMVVESYEFPFTAGEGNQVFTIKGYSDEGYRLLEEST